MGMYGSQWGSLAASCVQFIKSRIFYCNLMHKMQSVSWIFQTVLTRKKTKVSEATKASRVDIF